MTRGAEGRRWHHERRPKPVNRQLEAATSLARFALRHSLIARRDYPIVTTSARPVVTNTLPSLILCSLTARRIPYP